jgi:hypothetical protein
MSAMLYASDGRAKKIERKKYGVKALRRLHMKGRFNGKLDDHAARIRAKKALNSRPSW